MSAIRLPRSVRLARSSRPDSWRPRPLRRSSLSTPGTNGPRGVSSSPKRNTAMATWKPSRLYSALSSFMTRTITAFVRLLGLLLVTEAYHMRRAERDFRKEGFEVEPAPCAYRSAEFDGHWEQWIPNAGAITINEHTLHEWLALAR